MPTPFSESTQNPSISHSLISEKLTHVSHELPFMHSNLTNVEQCSACNSKCRIVRCTKCKFTLDFKCATLPYTEMHKQHKHPFTLSSIVEGGLGEYYCDVCEKE